MMLTLLLSCLFPAGHAFEGIVHKKTFHLTSYTTVQGQALRGVAIGYETYGTLNPDKSNAVLVTHHYSGNSHAAGKYAFTDTAPGYWDAIIGPGKPLDTEKYFVISSDTLVNIGTKDPKVTTTGPASLDPATGKPYGMKFPSVRITDFVRVQRNLLLSLGIKKLHAVMGASSGAAQAVEWSVRYPDDVARVVAVVPPGLATPPYAVALVNRWCAPIRLNPREGLLEAVKLLTHSAVYLDWGPREAGKIEEALEAAASSRAKAYDAESFLYMARAIQSFDVSDRIKDIKAKVLFIPAEKDMIFPPEVAEQAAEKLRGADVRTEVVLLTGRGGHIDGLTRIGEVGKDIAAFLAKP